MNQYCLVVTVLAPTGWPLPKEVLLEARVISDVARQEIPEDQIISSASVPGWGSFPVAAEIKREGMDFLKPFVPTQSEKSKVIFNRIGGVKLS